MYFFVVSGVFIYMSNLVIGHSANYSRRAIMGNPY